MRRLVTIILAGMALVLSGCAVLSDSSVTVKELRCEYRINPLGIDVVEPRLSWIIESQQRGQKQSGYRLLAASSEEKLAADDGNLWDSGKVESDQSIHIVYRGVPLKSSMRCYWKVRVWDKNGKASGWSKPAWWEMALLGPEEWAGLWISDGKPTPQRDEDFYKDDPAPLFRRELDVEKAIRRARLYISGLGHYEAYLNGNRVGDHLLDPGWTTYSKRVFYSTYDVTRQLRQGRNCVGVMLGNGWYNPLPMRMWGWLNLREHLTIGRPRLIAQLNIEYTDGTQQSVVTDESWKVSISPIVRNNSYLGEVYDARREKPGWDLPGFDDTDWQQAVIASEPLGPLCAQPQPPIRVTAILKPVKLTQAEPGVYIFDMGQNFAGWVKLRVKGPAGTKVKLRYGELLYPDGTLNVMTTVCGQIKAKDAGGPGAPPVAYQSDTYILKGGGEEVYTQRFSYHGFRYIEVTGYPDEPKLDAVEGLRLNTAVEEVGSFRCSNELFNRIQKMVRWTFLSNFFSVQSDCPGREKFGYGGDAVYTSEAQAFNYDMACFYAKMVRDFADAARPSGALTETAPFVGIASGGFGEGSGPIGWVISHPFLQQTIYKYYGDRRILEEQYETVRRSVEFIRSKADNHIINVGISDHESIEPKPIALTGTAFYYQHAQILSRFAHILGFGKDAEQYAALAQEIKEAFIKEFLKPGTGQFDSHTQACQAFALHHDLVPPNERQAAIDVLLDEILVRHKGHLSTGIFGTKCMLDVLTRIGRADVAYTIVNQKTFPGWGYMLENGATTMWEHWAFSDNIFSHNHSMFGSVSEWFFKVLGGIGPHPEAVGFDRIIIKPQVVGGLMWAKASYKSIRGRIVSDWRLENGLFHLNITIPTNTTAMVYVPAKDVRSVTESGQPADKAEGVEFLRMENGAAVYHVGSGSYLFAAKGAKQISAAQ